MEEEAPGEAAAAEADGCAEVRRPQASERRGPALSESGRQHGGGAAAEV